jgi:hypothetical protein
VGRGGCIALPRPKAGLGPARGEKTHLHPPTHLPFLPASPPRALPLSPQGHKSPIALESTRSHAAQRRPAVRAQEGGWFCQRPASATGAAHAVLPTHPPAPCTAPVRRQPVTTQPIRALRIHRKIYVLYPFLDPIGEESSYISFTVNKRFTPIRRQECRVSSSTE